MKRWYITRKDASELAHRFGEFALRDTDAKYVVIEADDEAETVQSCAFDVFPIPDSAYANADNWDEWVVNGGDYARLIAEITEAFGPPDED